MTSLSTRSAGHLNELASITDEETAEFERLTRETAGDPQRTARTLDEQARALAALAGQLDRIILSAGSERAGALREARARHAAASAAARAAARAASGDAFASDPLGEIGSDAWKSLWRAARAYSQTVYPERGFPVAVADAHCVLCQQTLGPEAADRFHRFDRFVEDETGREEQDARAALEAIERDAKAAAPVWAAFPKAIAPLRDVHDRGDLADAVRAATVRAAWRLRAILRGVSPDSHPDLPAVPGEALRALQADLTERARVLRADATSPERRALDLRRRELADRKWLFEHRADVNAEIGRLDARGKLEAAKRQTATNAITSFSRELAAQLVTEPVKQRFARELHALGLTATAVEMCEEAARGVTSFCVRLTDAKDANAADVLSEGEQRCVALAAFLAELATADGASAIVFDDPVSSLDHAHREHVAKRLAEEACARQVIVFTHDVAFYLELDEACRELGVERTCRLVSRVGREAGFCHNQPPQDVKPLDTVLGGLREHLCNVERHHAGGDQDRWEHEVGGFRVALRKAWERAVEEALSPVVKRLRRKVDTDRLAEVTVLEEADHDVMRVAYARCSETQHSQPLDIRRTPPAPADMRREIDDIAGWIASVRARQSDLVKRRKNAKIAT